MRNAGVHKRSINYSQQRVLTTKNLKVWHNTQRHNIALRVFYHQPFHPDGTERDTTPQNAPRGIVNYREWEVRNILKLHVLNNCLCPTLEPWHTSYWLREMIYARYRTSLSRRKKRKIGIKTSWRIFQGSTESILLSWSDWPLRVILASHHILKKHEATA